MIWLAWRQFRGRAVVGVAALIVLLVVILITRAHLVEVYNASIASCKRYDDCSQAANTFTGLDSKLQAWLGIVVIVVPALLGMFWGAPLVAGDLEAGTQRVAWTQSVTRTRWVVTKLALVGSASIAVAGVVTLSVTWWASLIDKVNADQFSVFDARDVVPIAYAAFAFALGVAIGALVRKTLPAMALTLVGFVGVRLAVYEWIRPRYMAALRAFSAVPLPNFNGGGPVGFRGMNSGDWVVSEQTVDAAGKVFASASSVAQRGVFGLNIGPNFGLNIAPTGRITLSDGQVCSNLVPTSALGPLRPGQLGPPSPKLFDAVQSCLDKLHIRDLYLYQPPNRYWPFQWYEFALFSCLAIALAALSVWIVRHKIA